MYLGTFLMRYLGISIHCRKLSNADWLKVHERLKNLSPGGLTLINSVLSSLPRYMMSFFEIPRGVLKNLDYFQSRFFWQCDDHERKYRLAKWNILCQPKDQGGLGIHNLNIKNTTLLSKWLFYLLTFYNRWNMAADTTK